MNGDCDAAREMCRRARAVLRDLGQGVRAASASFDLAMIELLSGDPAAAEREVRPDCEMLEKIGETFFLSSMAAVLARAVREQGRDDEALEVTRLAEKSAAPNDIDAQVAWRCIRAPILARAGALEEAEALMRAAVDMAKQTEIAGLVGVVLVGARDGAAPAWPETRSTPGARRGAQDLRREGRSHGGAAAARRGERRLKRHRSSKSPDALPRQRLLPGKLRCKGDRLEVGCSTTIESERERLDRRQVAVRP